jgi:hypothetical protein
VSPLGYRPERRAESHAAIERQPNTQPIAVSTAGVMAGQCFVHHRYLSYAEVKAGECSWCRPSAGEGAAEQGRLT